MQTVKYFADVAGSLERVLCLCVEYDLAKMWQSSIVMESHVMHTALRRETFYGARRCLGSANPAGHAWLLAQAAALSFWLVTP